MACGYEYKREEDHEKGKDWDGQILGDKKFFNIKETVNIEMDDNLPYVSFKGELTDGVLHLCICPKCGNVIAG